MKKLLLQLIVCGAALLPFTQAQAAGPASKNYGGFAPGYSFKLTMIEKPIASIAGITGSGILKKVPTGFPAFKADQNVSFKIGTKGELMVANFSIPFHSGSESSNVYSAKTFTMVANFSQAAITKTAGKPTFMNLVLRKKTGSGLSTKLTQVVYLLDVPATPSK